MNSPVQAAVATVAAVGAAVNAPVTPIPIMPTARPAVSGAGGVSLSFGDVNINTEMDMATFEARVVAAVSRSLNS